MAASAGAAAAAAVAQAIKASGVIVRLDPGEFSKVLNRAKDPLVVIARGGWLSSKYQYLFSYKGLAFFTGSDAPLTLPAGCEVVTAKSIFVPG
jgi:ABC-type transport system substrate-binding protein